MRVSAVLFMLAMVGETLAAPATVATTTVEKRGWQQTVPLYGTLTSPRDAAVTPRVAGLVDSVAVDAGDRVDAGDTLIELDRRLDALTLETQEASITEARARLVEARRLRDEAQRLASRGAISTTELKSRSSQVSVRAAALQRLRAEADLQRERLARHVVVAPFAGVVRERQVEPGEYVAQTTPVVGLVSTERLRVDTAAPQQYFDLIDPGMPVRIQPEALDGDEIAGRVDVTVPASDALARSFLVRTFVSNENGRLAPGMSAKVLFDIQRSDPVLVAPRDALVRVPGGGTRMWVVVADTEVDSGYRAVKRQVTLGRSADGVVEVRSGLEPGERVVVRGNESLENNEPVRVREATAGSQPSALPERSLRLTGGQAS